HFPQLFFRFPFKLSISDPAVRGRKTARTGEWSLSLLRHQCSTARLTRALCRKQRSSHPRGQPPPSHRFSANGLGLYSIYFFDSSHARTFGFARIRRPSSRTWNNAPAPADIL